MTFLVLVVGAGVLLTWMLVHSYSGRAGSPIRRRGHSAHTGDGGEAGWMVSGSGADASDCSAGDAGGAAVTAVAGVAGVAATERNVIALVKALDFVRKALDALPGDTSAPAESKQQIRERAEGKIRQLGGL